jgi:enoyl-CoA hydratase
MLEITHRGRVAVMTMRHGKANALDLEFCNEIVGRFEDLRSSAAEAVVLTGQGRIFSAGVDLLRAADGGPDYLRVFLPVLNKAFETVFFFSKPVVAAVNGHAVAGGCVLACATDRRIMAREPGRIGVTELLVGLPFPAMAFEIMRFAAAPQYFEDIVFSGATYAPDAARERGLVDEVVDAGLIERAVAAAEALASLRPAAFALTKRQSRQAVQDRVQQDASRFDPAVNDIWTTPETVTRIRDYVARTFKKS